MAAPKIVHDLVERFRLHRDDYQAGGYKESQLRQEFIDPLFKALGWDIDNEQGIPNLNEKRQRAVHDKMVAHVENVMRLNEERTESKPGHAQTVIQRQIEATDRQVDQLVYELYGLTDDEIRLVEEATA